MLFTEKLNYFNKEVALAVDKLFEKAYQNQSDPYDLLLIIIHGFYNPDVSEFNSNRKFSPYVFGAGNEGLMGGTQYEFYNWFRKKFTQEGDPIQVMEAFKAQEDWRSARSVLVQMELMVYLKFWESDMILKQLFNLCRLIHGEDYDWHVVLSMSRKNLMQFDIKDKTKRLIPKFYNLIDKVYNRQIRNAAAHSQIWLAGDYMNLFNEDANAGHHLKNVTIDEWEEVFHKTVLFYNNLIRNLNKYHQKYKEEAKERHFGLPLRITEKSGKIKKVWLRLDDPFDIRSRWIWYKNFEQHQMKRIYII